VFYFGGFTGASCRVQGYVYLKTACTGAVGGGVPENYRSHAERDLGHAPRLFVSSFDFAPTVYTGLADVGTSEGDDGPPCVLKVTVYCSRRRWDARDRRSATPIEWTRNTIWSRAAASVMEIQSIFEGNIPIHWRMSIATRCSAYQQWREFGRGSFLTPAQRRSFATATGRRAFVRFCHRRPDEFINLGVVGQMTESSGSKCGERYATPANRSTISASS